MYRTQSTQWFSWLRLFNNLRSKHVAKTLLTSSLNDTRGFHAYLIKSWSTIPYSTYRLYSTHSSAKDYILPKLIYLRSPFEYLKVKLDLLRLKLMWDLSFEENAFRIGSTKAAIVITDSICNKNIEEIRKFTTPSGYKQIVNDLKLITVDYRFELLKFRYFDIVRTVPTRIYLLNRKGRKHCFIDIMFVGMRNVKDFDKDEFERVQKAVQRYDYQQGDFEDRNIQSRNGRIIFAEIFIRFYREYNEATLDDWNIAFYKVPFFDILKF